MPKTQFNPKKSIQRTVVKKTKKKRRVRFNAVISQTMTWKELNTYQVKRTGRTSLKVKMPKGILKKSSYQSTV